jgi:NAD(P)-dependent dehydrogenase (short-subunit alcohol dehydrogenase family)
MSAAATALVTGASRGIGLAVAQEFLRRGMAVCITGRKDHSLVEAVEALGVPERTLAVAGSSADPQHRADAAAQTITRFGSLDVLVNSAGINPVYGPLMSTDLAVVDKAMTTNVIAPLGWIQEAFRRWMGQHGGAVVNVAAIAGVRTQLGLGAYTTSKAALLHLTRQLAYELGPGIRVNAVVPALVRTRFAAALWENAEDELIAHYPLRRLGTPEDIAKAVAFLACEDSSWITGDTLVIDGGQLVNDSVSRPA